MLAKPTWLIGVGTEKLRRLSAVFCRPITPDSRGKSTKTMRCLARKAANPPLVLGNQPARVGAISAPASPCPPLPFESPSRIEAEGLGAENSSRPSRMRTCANSVALAQARTCSREGGWQDRRCWPTTRAYSPAARRSAVPAPAVHWSMQTDCLWRWPGGRLLPPWPCCGATLVLHPSRATQQSCSHGAAGWLPCPRAPPLRAFQGPVAADRVRQPVLPSRMPPALVFS